MNTLLNQSHFDKALNYFNKQQPEKAIKSAIRQIKINPKHIDAFKLIAYIEFQSRNFNKALEYLSRALKINPDHPEINNLIGCIFMETGQFEKSIPYFVKSIDNKSTYIDPYINLIVAYQSLNQHELAYETCLTGMSASNNDLNFISRCANLIISNRQYSKAKEIFSAWIKLQPTSLAANTGLAKCYLALNDVESVIFLLNSLKNTPDKSPLIRMDVSNELLQFGKTNEAINEYLALLDIFPDKAAIYNNIASAYDHLQNTDKTIEYFYKSISENKNYVPARLNLGRVLTDINRLDEAEEMLLKALSIEPDNINALINIGRLSDIKKEPSKSLEFLNRAVKSDPDNPIVHCNLGNTYHQLGDFEASCQHYKTCLSLDPAYGDAEQNLGINELAMGKFDTAWGHYFKRMRNLERGEKLSPITPGMSLSGKHVYFCRSQGIGDELFFLRFLPVLKKQGVTITYRASKKTYTLFSQVPEIDYIIDEDAEIPVADLYFTIDDLPLILNINDKSKIPGSLTLKAEPERIEKAKLLLEKFPPPYTAITWRAGTQETPKDNRDKQRNLNKILPMEELKQITAPLSGSIIILQRKPENAELIELKEIIKQPLVDLSDYNESLEDMLALLSLIDNYIGVSNTNMHLLAALGKTADVLVPFPPDWRWMVKGKSSPWFPGFGIYRQAKSGDWHQATSGLVSKLESEHEA